MFVAPSEGGTPLQISASRFQHGGLAFRASEVVWSPDGKSLLMSTNRHPDWELEPLNTEVYEFDVATGETHELTKRTGPDNAPAVSPDGKWIAYTGFDDKRQGYQVNKLYVMARDGSSPRQVTVTWDRDVQQPAWAPDGKGIYFLSDDRGNTGVFYTNLDGSVKKMAGNIGSSLSAYAGGANKTTATVRGSPPSHQTVL